MYKFFFGPFHCAVVTSTGQNCSRPHVTSHVENIVSHLLTNIKNYV